MVSFGNTISRFLGSVGIRWTNTDEPISRYRRAERALRNPAVWYAVNKIAGHIGQLPLNIHQQVGREIKMPIDHWGYRLLRVAPNPYQSPVVFKRLITSHALLWGNGYAYIRKVGRQVVELIPLRPDCMQVGLLNGEKVFVYDLDPDERVSIWEKLEDEQAIPFVNEQILHIQGLGSDGVSGYSLISLAADAWEAGNAATKRNLSQIRKGHSGGVVLEVPSGQLRDESKAKEFLDAWRRDNDGEMNAGKTAMLREGVQAKVLAMSNRDAEFIETLKFMRQEEALRFMLESILGDDASVSYNSLEQKNLAYMQNCLNTWLRVWEEECELKLLSEGEMRDGYYFKFNDGALLRTDKKTSMETASLAIQNKIWTRNEVRIMFDMDPVEGGDVFENPAITPGDGTESEVERDASETVSTSETSEPQNKAAASVLAMMFNTEASRVVALANKPKFQLKTLDNFYKTWEVKLADKLEEIGLDRQLATTHCEESKRRILAVCNDAQPERIGDAIKTCVASWKLRANTVLGEYAHV